MKLSENFDLSEFIISQTAVRNEINNIPNEEQIENLKHLCVKVLEPLRALLNKPIHISSGYRCPELNTKIGGAKNSQHTEGKAADIEVTGMTTEELFRFISASGLWFDQLIQEFDSWVHVSWNDANRHQKLRATRNNGQTFYSQV